MKNIINCCLNIIILLLVCSGCTNAQDNIRAKEQLLTSKKVLIVYLSRTNNTKAIAQIIHKNVGGNLIALTLEKPYPADYQTTVKQVTEENDQGYLPLLKTKIEDMTNYDIVFIGFPTWGMQLPPPIKSFLNQYNLKGKTIIPFNTNAGYGIGNSFDQLKELCPNSKILEGFSMKGGVERDEQLLVIKDEKEKLAEKEVVKWLKTLNNLE